jgi:squalene-hopene/tetraprenyl-beta-curcumene cyclase
MYRGWHASARSIGDSCYMLCQMNLNADRLRRASKHAREALLAERVPQGHWVGELSTSALSTATAVCALAVVERSGAKHSDSLRPLLEGGLDWLAKNANADGGWGDTTLSLSNISTTTLCWASFAAVPGGEGNHRETVAAAKRWLVQHAGGVEPEKLVPAIIARYGKDRTFSIPILTLCALAGRLGCGPDAWRWVQQLPYELAALPQSWFAALRLPVVSYALPALIAIGQVRHRNLPTRNPLTRLLRNWTSERTLQVLTSIQPGNGGFLEATPLTSFVTMSLAGCGLAEHPVSRKGVEFLKASVRPDGSWPIDTNLATWVTTLSVNALEGSAGDSSAVSSCPLEAAMSREERIRIRDWLLNQQYRRVHPYTNAPPGGWAWTDLPGGVPDADDTAGALLALKNLGEIDASTRQAAIAGVTWLLNLQNRDGGIPTFCRGWTNLPFDRSGPDLTAHALNAWRAWNEEMPEVTRERIERGVTRATDYLSRTQEREGCWTPLWFGNQHSSGDVNPTYGTSKVLLSQAEFVCRRFAASVTLSAPAIAWLVKSQKPDGSWGGGPDSPGTVEETALAVEALATLGPQAVGTVSTPTSAATRKGTLWLVEQVEADSWQQPAPIGFYFAKLWYYEKLYPMIYTVGALQRVERLCNRDPSIIRQ